MRQSAAKERVVCHGDSRGGYKTLVCSLFVSVVQNLHLHQNKPPKPSSSEISHHATWSLKFKAAANTQKKMVSGDAEGGMGSLPSANNRAVEERREGGGGGDMEKTERG